MIKTSKNFSSQISLTDKGLSWALGKGSERIWLIWRLKAFWIIEATLEGEAMVWMTFQGQKLKS